MWKHPLSQYPFRSNKGHLTNTHIEGFHSETLPRVERQGWRALSWLWTVAVDAVGRTGFRHLINSREGGTQSRQQPIHVYHLYEAIPLAAFVSNVGTDPSINGKDKTGDQTHWLAGDHKLFSTGTIHQLLLLSDLIIHSATCHRKWLSFALLLPGRKLTLNLTKTNTLPSPPFLPSAQLAICAQTWNDLFATFSGEKGHSKNT